MNYILLLTLAFFFGVTNKVADLLNEHGLKLFKHADILFGIIWGILGAFLMFFDQSIAINYFALIIYWFFMIKLDYKNHSLAGTIMLFAGIYIIDFTNFVILQILLLFLLDFITILIQHKIARSFPLLARLRLRIYLIPLLYSILMDNYLIFYVTVVAMIGVEIITISYDHYLKKNKK
ncbi:hypothetical protein M0P25_04865 [archaeon]|nr:hypothetical protein [archaeon]MCK9439383.1 hypothetical protein [Patescibacteria group bacterium]MDD3919425.1 hypothetical protein [Candidatus Paceibacterota bacterium]